jgi:hypothetical protein
MDNDLLLDTWDGLCLTYGDFLSHNEVDRTFMSPKPSVLEYASEGRLDAYDAAISEWHLERLSRMEALRKLVLEQRKMMLVSSRGEGYRVCHPEAQVEVAAMQFRSTVLREAVKLSRSAANVNYGAISDDAERQRVVLQADAAQGLSAFLSGSVRKMKIEFEF